MASSYDNATKWKIEHAGRTVAGFFFAISVIAVSGRVAVRLAIQRRLFVDDYTLLFSLASLGAATGIIYMFDWLIYVANILKYDSTVLPTVSDLKALENAQAINYSFLALMWSTVYSVKLCFLVSFKILIKNVSRSIEAWYWFTVSLVVIFWAFMVTVPFIVCPYSGPELIRHCTPETPSKITWIAIGISLASDVITDMMIVAIPIYILRRVRIRLTQKFGIAAFVTLSVVMIILAVIRPPLSRYHGSGDTATLYILLYVESCIAITMAAVAAYRAVFVEYNRHQEQARQEALDHQQRMRPNHPNKQAPSETARGRIQQLQDAAKPQRP
ncbi:hypothetical protein BGZ60DRAFT_437137 [Tricladium varicosporioides]|nr:hypothetical protein BGZ60DRAFT_437137 [Hymenoscyphus varicosporioides]